MKGTEEQETFETDEPFEADDTDGEDWAGDWPEQEDQEEDWPEEPAFGQRGKMLLVFAAMVAVAAVLCAGLWFVTHRNGSEPDGRGEVASGDTTGPEITLPPEPEGGATEAGTGGPSALEPEGGETETGTGAPSASEPEGGASEAGTGAPSASEPEGGTTEAGTGGPSASEPEGGSSAPKSEAGTGGPAASEPEGSTTEAGTGAPSASEPEGGETETGTGAPAASEPENGDSTMRFEAVQESVTPKDVVNLRTVPSTADAETVVVQVSNGQVLSRSGINRDTGWSKIDYEGQTLYAVTQYLTTDLSYKTPVTPLDPNRVSTISGRVIIFTDCDDQLTPKEYVNLRTEPSTTEGDATVSCQVSSGEAVHRTGVSADSGWSRVEYNGQVLYVVTSLMQAAQ